MKDVSEFLSRLKLDCKCFDMSALLGKLDLAVLSIEFSSFSCRVLFFFETAEARLPMCIYETFWLESILSIFPDMGVAFIVNELFILGVPLSDSTRLPNALTSVSFAFS